MKEKILQPNQLILPYEEGIGNELILKIYFKIFNKKHGIDLPPVIITSSQLDKDTLAPAREYRRIIHAIEEDERKGEYVNPESREYNKKCYISDMEKYSNILEKIAQLNKSGAGYLLLDGNHRSIAATLAHQQISALELQTDEDLNEIRKRVETGELFDFPHKQKCLYDIIDYFIDFSFDHKNVKTLQQRVEELISGGHIPEYMRKKWKK